MAFALSTACPPHVVVDTNVVLDCLLFRDAGADGLIHAVTSRAVSWISCSRMREEFARTLGYPALDKWMPDSERLLATFDRWTRAVPDPASTLPALRCSDPDDQVFLDLAAAVNAQWLVTHDRALLRLARRAGTLGIRIVRPPHFVVDD